MKTFFLSISTVFTFLLLQLANAAGNEEIMFNCTLKDGAEVKLTQIPQGDLWTLTIGYPDKVQVSFTKPGNDMGRQFSYHRESNLATREVFMTNPTGNWFYTLGVDDNGKAKSGYIQVMNSGTETAYEHCVTGSLHEQFEKEGAFVNMTVVD